MYNRNHLGIVADWLYAEPNISSGNWYYYSHFVDIVAGSSSQTASCGGLAKLLLGVIRGHPGYTWSLVAYTPELVYFNQGIGGCSFAQSGHYAWTGEYLAFQIWRSSDSKWYMMGYIDNSWQPVQGPFTPGWTNNYASRVGVGYEIWAVDGYSLSTIHQPTISVGSDIAVETVSDGLRTWSDMDLPIDYKYQTSTTINSPWQYQSNVMPNYYGAIRARIP